jgi:integrase
MAIEKLPNSKYWRANIYVGKGKKRITKSLKTTDKATALMMEKALVEAIEKKRSVDSAIKIINDAIPTAGVRLEASVEMYIALAEKFGEDTSSKGFKACVSALKRMSLYMLATGRAKSVAEITEREAWDFQMSLANGEKYERRVKCHKRWFERVESKPLTAKSRNTTVGSLTTVWKAFIREGLAYNNPWTLARVKRNASEETHGRAFTREEERKILESAKKFGHQMYEACVLAKNTGLRGTDIWDLTWTNVTELSDNGGWITITPKKTARFGRSIRIPFGAEVANMLKSLDRATQKASVLPELPSDLWRDERDRRAFTCILDDAGITAKKGEVLTFHCWRNTFTSRLAEAGVSQDIRMKLCGWTSPNIEALYNTDESKMREAIDRLNAQG